MLYVSTMIFYLRNLNFFGILIQDGSETSSPAPALDTRVWMYNIMTTLCIFYRVYRKLKVIS